MVFISPFFYPKIHEILDDTTKATSILESRFAFRLLYNGYILTDKVKGCIPGLELCDSQHLVNRVKPFARRNVDCLDVNLEKAIIHPLQVAKALLTTTGGIILVLLIVAVSALVGSIGVFYYLTGSVPTEKLQTIKRQVFPSSRHPYGADVDGASPSSLVLNEHEEMNMADAADLDDGFDDEPMQQ